MIVKFDRNLHQVIELSNGDTFIMSSEKNILYVRLKSSIPIFDGYLSLNNAMLYSIDKNANLPCIPVDVEVTVKT